MGELVHANFVTNLAYYRRSRLLLAFLLVFLLILGLESLPPLFMRSGMSKLNALQGIFETMNGLVMVLSAGLGLFVVSSHVRSRSLKMVFTKPCSPAVWLLAAFLSAVASSLLLYGVVLGSTLALSLIWKVPVQAGMVFLSTDSFLASLGLIAYLMLLGMVLHPAVAATVAVIFNADVFYNVQTWALAAIRAGNKSVALRVLERFFHGLYLVLPMVSPFSKQTQGVYSSMRVLPGDWKYLAYSLGYALMLSLFCYCVALFALERKKLI